MKASRSPSPSMSPRVGVLWDPMSKRPNGLVSGALKAGALADPVFRRKIKFPENSPTRASRSPSPSTSARSGEAMNPTPARPKGPIDRAGEGRQRCRSRVLEEVGVAGVVADERVEIAVAVDVGELGGGVASHAGESEGVRRSGGEGREARRAGVLEEERVARAHADEDVEVAIGVDVREGRVLPEQAEGIGRVAREDRQARASGVAEEAKDEIPQRAQEAHPGHRLRRCRRRMAWRPQEGGRPRNQTEGVSGDLECGRARASPCSRMRW